MTNKKKRHSSKRLQRRARTITLAALTVLAVLGGATLALIAALPRDPDRNAPRVEIAAPPLTASSSRAPATTAPSDPPAAVVAILPTPTASPAPTAAPTVAPTATLAPAPEAMRRPANALSETAYRQSASPGADYADPAGNGLLSMTQVFDDERASGEAVTAPRGIEMGASADYASLEGVTTFRGSNYRDGGSSGTIPENPSRLFVAWKKRIGSLDKWSGVGWTGQCSIVRWPADLRARMNIVRAKKQKDDLAEVLYATLDGHIYFLDLGDGQPTRNAINIGAPIKGSLSVDPRGVPLLYCGQGLNKVGERSVPCGLRIWSLIDQQQLYFLDGRDARALRAWSAFDGSPLVDGDADTMITAGENGVLYRILLNTRQAAGSVSIDPVVTRYVYKQSKDGKLGTENSVAVYNHYAYFATNIGIIQCVDLNTMSLVWSFDARDDIDASLVIEPEGDGLVALYAVNEVDRRGHSGACQMYKLNALSGEVLWCRDSDPIRHEDENGGGGFATPASGKQDLKGLVYFHVCRTRDSQGMLYALNKQTGETVWSKAMGSYGWSSPTCVYTAAGKGYVLVGSSSGALRLLDGLSGEEVAAVRLEGNIEASPAVFDDMIVVGTRAGLIYGIKIV